MSWYPLVQMVAIGLVAILCARYAVVERRRRAQASSLRTEVELLRDLVDHSQVVTWVKDLDGRYLVVNDLFLQLAGISREELIGQTVAVFALPEAMNQDSQGETLGELQEHRFEVTAETPAGGLTFECVKFPLRNAHGDVYGIGGVARDVTDERRAVSSLIEANTAAMSATSAKSAFVATMSHEIRTPMNAVIGMADLLRDTELDENQLELVDTVRSSGDALLALINDLLDFSKIEAGQLEIHHETFLLHDTVESCLDLVATEAAAKHLDLICDIGPECPTQAVGDATRLRQILVNLLYNAVKFTETGQVVLTLGAARVDERLRLTCTVADSGIGIAPSGLPLLFTAFSQIETTTSDAPSGTGLGLAISQRLAAAMDGQIRVDSVLGAGSTFTLELLVDPDPAGGFEQAPTVVPALAGVLALVVDDNAASLHNLKDRLARCGVTCTTAASPAAALVLVRGGMRFDVALLDLAMPAMGGMALATALRSAGLSSPLILMSAASARPAGAEHLFAAFVSKPVKGAGLRRALTTALDVPSADRAASSPAQLTIARTDLPLRVLLAEDNRVNQRVAELMLARLGHEVEIVDNGAAALDAVRTTCYDVVLMDVQMPQLDGLEATLLIRRDVTVEKQPYIIAMTAKAMVEDRRACAEAGMDGYLTKPFRVHELEQALNGVHSTAPQAHRAIGPAASSHLVRSDPRRVLPPVSDLAEPTSTLA